ncbi:carboxymuconolactone decarboxylase family protein [Phaeocystidibacter luteus]|uniref:Carboxymuconolactone decarboxylase family protein n=1 Tax=Phaeocystidibacter luteus TaxID=911197 RepID=A0A6N6RI04_9FLAO|nr:carboxymuconolactone decarboxylase family protein [Phaeocystidibacter luteus]KAB2809917.1 carboxymuconolactone decarboxylase family protein [Phaeocystidibacter luteus]
MATFNVPTREEVSENNQAIFDKLQGMLGMVPNLYAFYAHSENALGDILGLQNRKTSLNNKEKEVVNLVTSQVNGCRYCQSAHTAVGKMNGFTDDQILEIRSGRASFNEKLDALARFTQSWVENRGRASEASVNALLESGYSQESLVDIALVIADKTVSNFIHNLAQFEIDFPVAPELEAAAV